MSDSWVWRIVCGILLVLVRSRLFMGFVGMKAMWNVLDYR